MYTPNKKDPNYKKDTYERKQESTTIAKDCNTSPSATERNAGYAFISYEHSTLAKRDQKENSHI